MSIRRVDVRFVLPREPRSALVFGPLPEFRAGLVAAGIPTDGDGVLLAVATPRTVQQALASGADMIVVEGGDVARRLRPAGYHCRVIMPMPSLELPELLLPLRDAEAARRLFRTWRKHSGVRGHVRHTLAWSAAATGAAARLRPVFTVGTRIPGAPFPIAAAESLGVPADVSWFIASPGVDGLSRVVFLLAPRGTPEARWALKVSRSQGATTAFVNEERALALLATAGNDVSGRAPRLHGRFTADDHECSLETAAPGERLSTLLHRDVAAAIPLVDQVASWIVALGRATVSPGGSDVELDRIAEHVLPLWPAPRHLLATVAGIPSVLAHHDLGPWNIVAAGLEFTALDWEDARPGALPLWDLAYFLVHALTVADGTMNEAEPAGAMLALLRGETPASATFFRWLRAGADSLDIEYDVVPALISLCWLHHGLSHTARAALAGPDDGTTPVFVPPVEQLAPAWLADPALGQSWPAWHASLR